LAGEGTDFRYLEQVVELGYPVRDARTYLNRHMGNPVQLRLVEARRGESMGRVREIEVRHANSGLKSWVRGERLLPGGAPASFFVPDHLVTVKPRVEGAAAETRSLHPRDEIILHIPVRSYLRFLPEIFQGEGPVTSREATQVRATEVQRYMGQDQAEVQASEQERDEDPLRRFLLVFQHLMLPLIEGIEHLPDLTDPLLCEAKMLPWLASWVGFELDESLPVHQQRELVRRAIRLMRSRGTRAGIEDMVRVLTSAPVRVEERVFPRAMVLGANLVIGGRDVVERFEKSEPLGCYLLEPAGRRPTSFFSLRLEPQERFRERFGDRAPQVLRRIVNVVSQERPTHIAFVVRFDDRR
jgi:phage tail-like protein